MDKKTTGSNNDIQFNLTDLKLSQDFGAEVGVQKLITTIPIRKPNKHEFVRVHPDPEFQLQTAMIEVKEDRETYFVDQAIAIQLPDVVVPKLVVVSINRQGVLFLWPIRLPGPDGRHDNWNSSALEASNISQGKWIKVTSNMSLGAYEVYEAVANLPEPEWPDLSFPQIVEIACKDRFIKSLDHPVIKKIRGEI
jgi:hypothetical protein